MEKCKCTICNLGRFPQTKTEINFFDLMHSKDPLPSEEFFEDQLQQIHLLLEIDKILNLNLKKRKDEPE